MPFTRIQLVCSAYCGAPGENLVGSAQGAHWDEVDTGTPTVETTIVPPGATKAWRFTSTGSAVHKELNLPAGTRYYTARFYFRFVGSLPDANLEFLRGDAGNTLALRFLVASSTVIARAGSGTVSLGTVAANTWYYVDYEGDTNASPHLATGALDGATPVGTSEVIAAADFTRLRLGVITTGVNADMIAGRIVISYSPTSSGDFPIGVIEDGTTEAFALAPDNIDGSGSSAFIRSDGGATVTDFDDSGELVDGWPPNSSSYIEQNSTGGGGQFIRIRYDTGAVTAQPLAVDQVVAVVAGSAGANTQGAWLDDNGDEAASYQDISTNGTTIRYLHGAGIGGDVRVWDLGVDGGAWDLNDFVGLILRWGFASDIAPPPRLLGSILEVELDAAPAAPPGPGPALDAAWYDFRKRGFAWTQFWMDQPPAGAAADRTASGSAVASGAAAGQKGAAGLAFGSGSGSGAGVGQKGAQGPSSGSASGGGNTVGGEGHADTVSGAAASSGAAAGQKGGQGSASGSGGSSGAAVGTKAGSGVASGSAAASGATVGSKGASGVVAGSAAASGAAVGQEGDVGTGAGDATASGAAVGEKGANGAAAGSASGFGSCVGTAETIITGQASGSASSSGQASGEKGAQGVASGSSAAAGAAVGSKQAQGGASGSGSGSGAATGFSAQSGVAAGSSTGSGDTAGRKGASGSAAGSASSSGDTAGGRLVIGQASGSSAGSGAAAGRKGGESASSGGPSAGGQASGSHQGFRSIDGLVAATGLVAGIKGAFGTASGMSTASGAAGKVRALPRHSRAGVTTRSRLDTSVVVPGGIPKAGVAAPAGRPSAEVEP